MIAIALSPENLDVIATNQKMDALQKADLSIQMMYARRNNRVDYFCPDISGTNVFRGIVMSFEALERNYSMMWIENSPWINITMIVR